MARSEEATWMGGPRDGETIGIPAGCRRIWMSTTITADGDEDLVIDQRDVAIPIRMTNEGLRIMYYEGQLQDEPEE